MSAALHPCLAVDTLAVLPFAERIRAYEDFDAAVRNWAMARRERRAGGWEWRLDIRRAQRAWKHYTAAVRKAKAGRMAA